MVETCTLAVRHGVELVRGGERQRCLITAPILVDAVQQRLLHHTKTDA
jgi:hypothetical protein